jgi:hypothetical protein
MKQWFKEKGEKLLNWTLDGLLFVVPILEVTELIAVIPGEYLAWYMLVALILRRAVRILENHLRKEKDVTVASNKEQ